MKKSKSIFSSLRFKSWSYFMLFALSILLVLSITQLLFLEPFYRKTLRDQIVKMNRAISQLSFDEELEDEVRNERMYGLIAENNACVLIYNCDTSTPRAYDVLGETGCAIYADQTVNNVIIEEMDKTPDQSLFLEGNYLELSNQEVMIYGEKVQHNDEHFYIISNFALQSMNTVIKTTQNQFVIIALIVMALAIIISLIFSRFLSRPIVNMNEEAMKLARGNYDVHFEKGEFNELDELSDTLSLAARELSHIDETRRELVANVSHDLKTPLTMIKAYAEMIRDISGKSQKKREEHLQVIIQETDNLNQLVSDMLDLSKLQAGVIQLKIAPFDLSRNISEAVSKFATIAQKEEVDVEIDCEPELIAIGDVQRINEVLYNFISNALKHYGPDKKIIIKAYAVSTDTIRVEIADHGPGISEEILPYIWDRYFKSDKKYTRSQSGSGLGLAINKAILEEHGYKYGVETKEGEGSTFWFELKREVVD